MAYLPPLKGDFSSANVEIKSKMTKPGVPSGVPFSLKDKAQATVAIPAIIIFINIIVIIICSGIAGAGRGP